MKNYIKPTTLLLALLVFGFHTVSAQIEDPITTDSVIINGGSGFNISYGVANFPDSIYLQWQGDNGTIISTTTPYTILSITLIGFDLTDGFDFYCSGGNVNTPDDGTIAMSYGSDMASYSYTYNGQIHCKGNLNFSSAGIGTISLQYVPYDTRLKKADVGSNNITFGLAIIIVLLTLGYAGYIYNKMTKKPWK